MSTPNTALAVITKEIEERGIAPAVWSTMAEQLYPGASPKMVLSVWDYCAARKLDPLKKPVHIVPMRVKIGDEYVTRETVLPGIYEYRITAHRTGEYLGHDEPEFGPFIEELGVKAPEWCKYTVYRWNDKAKAKVPYTVRVMFKEAVGTKKDYKTKELTVNDRWSRAPVQMLTKCAEAAALREAFPEEIGGIPTMEEIEDHMPDVNVIDVTAQPIPTSWGRISEALRENLEKAFTTLKMTAAQRLAKVNEFVPNDATADEGAEKLLEWCKDEFARQAGKERKPASNKKDVAKTEAGATEAVAGPTTIPVVEAPASAPPAAEPEMVKSGEIPWGGKKAATEIVAGGLKERSAEEFF